MDEFEKVAVWVGYRESEGEERTIWQRMGRAYLSVCAI
jgi:hypothetical protein